VIRGLGIDIIEIERIRESIERKGADFLNRLFTQAEQEYCFRFKDAIPHFAGRFAAKEAVAKALGTGFGEHLSWKQIEILNDAAGKPVVFLSKDLQEKYNNPHLLIAISHSSHYANAVAVWDEI
jgi:holo-[acyl-carrier protein] synthase